MSPSFSRKAPPSSAADRPPLLISKTIPSSPEKKPLLLSKACAEDAGEILALFIDAINAMEQRGIHQWDEIYPANLECINADIDADELWIGRIDGTAAVVFVLNEQCDEEYRNGAWQYPDLPFRVIHRLCVHPAFGGQGVGTRTMHEIEAICLADGVEAIRLDAFSKNPIALALYENLGFKRVGSAQWRMGLFWLYEKPLTNDGAEVEKT